MDKYLQNKKKCNLLIIKKHKKLYKESKKN